MVTWGSAEHTSPRRRVLVLSLCWVCRSKAARECGALREGPKEKHNNLGEGELDVNAGGLTLACACALCEIVGVANETLSAW